MRIHVEHYYYYMSTLSFTYFIGTCLKLVQFIIIRVLLVTTLEPCIDWAKHLVLLFGLGWLWPQHLTLIGEKGRVGYSVFAGTACGSVKTSINYFKPECKLGTPCSFYCLFNNNILISLNYSLLFR